MKTGPKDPLEGDVPAVVLLSGGLDSTVLLAVEARAGRRPLCLSFDYGQLNGARELQAAKRIAAHYVCEWLLLTLPPDILGGSALTGELELPLGFAPKDPVQKKTVVPGRNMVLLSIAAAVAARRGLGKVLYGANLGDAVIYPDCRQLFLGAASEAALAGCGVKIVAPFIRTTKAEIVGTGRDMGAPLHLSWSCYTAGPDPCGMCGACMARREAGA